MKIIIAAAVLLLALPIFAQADELKPFTSDGCSSFPDGTPKTQTLWLNCCVRHDLAYWKGGTYQERLAADQALEHCVAKAGEPDIAKLMLQGVRAGGSPLLPTPFRWGYGWSFPRDYKALTDNELAQVRTQGEVLQSMLLELINETSKK